MIGWVWTLNLHVSKMAAMGKPPISLDYCICLVIKERISEIISMTQVNHTIYVHPGQFAAKNPIWPPKMVLGNNFWTKWAKNVNFLSNVWFMAIKNSIECLSLWLGVSGHLIWVFPRWRKPRNEFYHDCDVGERELVTTDLIIRIEWIEDRMLRHSEKGLMIWLMGWWTHIARQCFPQKIL